MTDLTIRAGQIYRSCDPRDDGRGVRIVRYAPGDARALVVDADTGKRTRPLLVAQLHASATTTSGTPRRTGYALEARPVTGTAPAAALRATADKLRTLAAAASVDTSGRSTATWSVRYRFITATGEPRREHGCYLDAGPDGHVQLLRSGSTGPHGRGTRPHMHAQHAEYIAAMDPAVGLALADLLDDLSDGDDEGVINPWALAVAQQLLGDTDA
ncbi:hypothetical protein ABZ442_05045 [Streptomyces triculaminicus]|uniref:hypothetical protein n=1 Tax=Streptomyces triculaminicus TaxID=2816232 RepID=UPI0033DF50EB